SFLSVGTGTTSGLSAAATSTQTTVMVYDQTKFTTQLLGGTTVFVGLQPQAATNINARVFNSTAPVVPAPGTIILSFDGEDSDTNNIHSTSSLTTRLTANTSGHYSN